MNIQKLASSVFPEKSPKNAVVSNNANQKTRNSIPGGVAGYFTATVLASELKDSLNWASAKIVGNIKEDLRNSGDLPKIPAIADSYIEKNGLKDKGVKVIKYSLQKPAAEQKEAFEAIVGGFNPLSKFLLKKSVEYNKPFLSEMAMLLSYPKNLLNSSALYIPKNKTLLIKDKFTGIDVFKELELASKKSPVPVLQKRLKGALSALLTPVLIISVCSRNKNIDKTSPSSSKTKKDKFTNFVRNNAGKISMAAMVPAMLININNSVRTANIAKKYATKSIAQAVYSTEAFNTVRMILFTLIIGISTAAGVEVKDWFQKRKDQKSAEAAQTATTK